MTHSCQDVRVMGSLQVNYLVYDWFIDLDNLLELKCTTF